MAKTSSIQKNNKRRNISQKFFAKRAELKKKINNKNLSLEERFAFILKLNDLPKDSSKIRVRNRCALTGRPRAYCRKIGLSRIKFRELAADGKLSGVVRASW